MIGNASLTRFNREQVTWCVKTHLICQMSKSAERNVSFTFKISWNDTKLVLTMDQNLNKYSKNQSMALNNKKENQLQGTHSPANAILQKVYQVLGNDLRSFELKMGTFRWLPIHCLNVSKAVAVGYSMRSTHHTAAFLIKHVQANQLLVETRCCQFKWKQTGLWLTWKMRKNNALLQPTPAQWFDRGTMAWEQIHKQFN